MLLMSFLYSLSLMAQLPPVSTSYFPVNPTPIDYTPTSVQSHPLQRLNVFLPNSTPPSTGFPVVAHINLGNFVSSNLLTEVSQARNRFLWNCLSNGIAVVAARVTVHDEFLLPGKGLFVPPGYTHSNAIFNYTDRDYHCAEKDVVMVVQHIRFNDGILGTSLEDVNGSRLAIHGGSAGAFASKWVAFGPDRSGASTFFPNPSGQELESTQVQAAVLAGGAIWIDAFQYTFSQFHFPVHSSYDVGIIGDIHPTARILASSLAYASISTLPPTHLAYGGGVNTPVYDRVLGSCGCEWLSDSESDPHSAWSGFVWKKLFPATRLILTDSSLYTNAIDQGISDALITNKAAIAADQSSWLLSVL